MKVLRITIENIGCIPHLEILPGTVTVLKGRNGTGKTSAIDAVSALVEGGHRPALIRHGAKRGVVTLETDECTIQRIITPKDSTYRVTSPDGSEVKRPAEFIKSLTTAFSFNPMDFIQADAKAKKQHILACCQITFQYDEVATACEDSNVRSEYDLEAFNLLREGKYNARRDVNRDIRNDEATLATLDTFTAVSDGTDWATVAKEREAALRQSEQILNEQLATIERNAQINQEWFKRERDERVAELQRQIQKERDQCDVNCIKAIEDASREKHNLSEQSRASLETLVRSVAEAQDKATAQLKAKGAKETVARLQATLDAKKHEAIKLDRVVQNLDELKQRKMSALPIQGVEIKDGELYLDGVPFDRLNLQKQIFISFELGALRMGKLPLVVSDNFEHIDRQNFNIFVDAVRETGWQVIVAQVDADAEQLTVQAVA